MRNEIISFRQIDDKSLFRLEKGTRSCRGSVSSWDPHMYSNEDFFNALLPRTRYMFDASSGGAFLTQSYQDSYAKIPTIAAKSYQWPTTNHNVVKKTA